MSQLREEDDDVGAEDVLADAAGCLSLGRDADEDADDIVSRPVGVVGGGPEVTPPPTAPL